MSERETEAGGLGLPGHTLSAPCLDSLSRGVGGLELGLPGSPRLLCAEWAVAVKEAAGWPMETVIMDEVGADVRNAQT